MGNEGQRRQEFWGRSPDHGVLVDATDIGTPKWYRNLIANATIGGLSALAYTQREHLPQIMEGVSFIAMAVFLMLTANTGISTAQVMQKLHKMRAEHPLRLRKLLGEMRDIPELQEGADRLMTKFFPQPESDV